MYMKVTISQGHYYKHEIGNDFLVFKYPVIYKKNSKFSLFLLKLM